MIFHTGNLKVTEDSLPECFKDGCLTIFRLLGGKCCAIFRNEFPRRYQTLVWVPWYFYMVIVFNVA